MSASRRASLAVCAALSVPIASCSVAHATAVTVKLRVEGATKTLFEAPVTTGPETIETLSSKGPHPCNYKENIGGVGELSGTATTALHDAAASAGLPFDAEWFPAEGGKPGGDFFVSQVGPDRNESSPPFDSWGLAINDKESKVGGCQVVPESGSEVLWAYNYFNLSHLLSLSGAASVNAGTPFAVHVSDGQTGESISGAAIGEVASGTTTAIPGVSTEASGNASVTLAHTGMFMLKASRADSVRSNGLVICVHNGNDGTCGTQTPTGGVSQTATPTATIAPPTAYMGPFAVVARTTGVLDGYVYLRTNAPRVLAGIVTAHTGVSSVGIELWREYRGRCWAYDGRTERFLRAPCAHGRFFKIPSASRFFKVSETRTFSYLMPFALARGEYVLDIAATDTAGNRTTLARGTSRIRFYVR